MRLFLTVSDLDAEFRTEFGFDLLEYVEQCHHARGNAKAGGRYVPGLTGDGHLVMARGLRGEYLARLVLQTHGEVAWKGLESVKGASDGGFDLVCAGLRYEVKTRSRLGEKQHEMVVRDRFGTLYLHPWHRAVFCATDEKTIEIVGQIARADFEALPLRPDSYDTGAMVRDVFYADLMPFECAS